MKKTPSRVQHSYGIVPIAAAVVTALLSTSFATEFSYNKPPIKGGEKNGQYSIFTQHENDKLDTFSKKIMIAKETHLSGETQITPGQEEATTNYSGKAPLSLKFDAMQYSRPGGECLWNFGDGDVAEGTNVSHEFQYPGTYSVTLRTEQQTGLIYLKRFLITVTGQYKDSSQASGPSQTSNKKAESRVQKFAIPRRQIRNNDFG